MFTDHSTLAPELAATTSSDTLAGAPEPDYVWRVLDEIDYDLMLVTPDGQLQHANHLARYELGLARLMFTQGKYIVGHSYEHTFALQHGIATAGTGRRHMVTLQRDAHTLTLACVPLFSPFEGTAASILLMLSRQVGNNHLAIAFFARAHGLTTAEEAVLRALCDGEDVQAIATARGASESTVRTQIKTLREKLQCGSLRQLVQHVANLPPVVPALRKQPLRLHNAEHLLAA